MSCLFLYHFILILLFILGGGAQRDVYFISYGRVHLFILIIYYLFCYCLGGSREAEGEAQHRAPRPVAVYVISILLFY